MIATRFSRAAKHAIFRQHGATVGLLLLIALVPGCTTVRSVAGGDGYRREGNVVLVRGLIDVFSLGLNRIERQLLDEGVWAQTFSGPMWRDVSRKIKREYRQGVLTGPLVVVGHSYGADDAVRLVRSLNADSIEVAVLALIDPTTPPAIPPNVRRCFNIYQSSPATDWIPVLRGVAVKAESDATVLVNYDVRAHNADGRFDHLDHFDIEESAVVQAIVLAEVLGACPIREGRAASGAGAEPERAASASAGMREASDG